MQKSGNHVVFSHFSLVPLLQYDLKQTMRVITATYECGFRIYGRFGIGEKVRVPGVIPELRRLK